MPTDHDPLHPIDHQAIEPAGMTSRRGFLLLSLGGLALLAGCGTAAPKTTRLPGPTWRGGELFPQPTVADSVRPAYTPPAAAPTGPSSMIARTRWTSVRPTYTSMNAMTPVHSITVHHDGMRPFFDTSDGAVIDRLEAIRRSHRDGRGWGDIGYHYAIDRDGRVWECRPLSHQGAHVANHNEGNIGVVALGNFDQQTPTSAQLDAVNRHVSWLMREHRVSIARVRTHREWEGARTACPGGALQRHMDRVRSGRAIG